MKRILVFKNCDFLEAIELNSNELAKAIFLQLVLSSANGYSYKLTF